MDQSETISAEYTALQKELHKNPNYGVASIGYAPLVKQVLEMSKARSLSDMAPESKTFGRRCTISE